MKKLLPLAAILFLVIFAQCRRDDIDHNTEDLISPAPITANINGNILDENGAPAAAVTVKVGDKTAVTDHRGYFRINNASLDKNASGVIAEKAGYFKAFQTFGATSGTNYVVIKLTKKELAGTVSATSGGFVSIPNGSKVDLPANGIVSAGTNTVYTGTVNVYMAYIDPSNADVSQRVPGSFMANDKEGNRVVLTSYGMVAVELETPSGQKLQIKQGSSATLTVSIPAAAQVNAPATIPLWSIDETTGLWKEESSATKTGGLYVGQVSHFSTWNPDVPNPPVTVSMQFKNSAGLPITNAQVKITVTASQGWPYMSYGYTDSLGQIRRNVPINSSLTIEMLDECNTIIHSQTAGPFSSSTNLGAITIPGTSQSLITISGKLVKCNNAPVTQGYAIISGINWVRYASVDANGIFQTSVVLCPTTSRIYHVTGIDNGAQLTGNPVSGTLTSPTTATGDISVCGVSLIQFIHYSIDGANYSITGAPGDSLLGYTHNQGMYYTSIQAMQMAGNRQIDFYFVHPTTTNGTYPVASIIVNGKASGPLAPPVNVSITSFPSVPGQYYEGGLSGTFTDSSGVHTVQAYFRVRRII